MNDSKHQDIAAQSASKSGGSPSEGWGKTLKLPQTSFAMRANLPAREPGWVQRWLDEGVYEKLLAKRRASAAPTRIIHLGPPYANGTFHMGHMMAYGLKDIMVRHAFMRGYASPYVPGWDCHGLPIEWKIETELRANGQTKADLSVTELRARCRAYAEHWIGVQQTEWQRLGVLADWQRPYKTMDKANEAGIVGVLGQLVQRGLVYNKLRSTLWAPVEETALAEAEIEYDENHTSTAVYVALELVDRPGEHLVIWTTTPWTLPANRAVAVNEGEKYLKLKRFGVSSKQQDITDVVDRLGEILWVAENCKEQLPDHLLFEIIGEGLGKDLLGLTYHHPLYAGRTGTVYHGDHVTTESGTGMVHIAPAHGPEDYDLGVAHGLELACPVNGSGRYEEWVEAGLPAGLTLGGRSVLDKTVTTDILTALGSKLLHAAPFKHKYPISWRSKAPVIYRTTTQWFIDLDKPLETLGGESVRERSLNVIHAKNGQRGVKWVPGYGENRIGSMIAGRPDWCISRQRAWGVPITIMVHKATQQPVTDAAVWAHLQALVAAEGIDAWDTRIEQNRHAELFPAGWLAAHNHTPADFTYVRDILDVWFDSGTTWRHVVEPESGEGQRFARNGDGKRPADIYEEGSDQHRGWFHSSLLTSVALTGDAPYESVVTHGFVVDGNGRKFSKSLGNGVEPRQLLDTYGMDIIRLWVGSSDYSDDVRYSDTIMAAAAEQYRTLRNTLRWLLGNLPAQGVAVPAVAIDALPELERYVLAKLHAVLAEAQAHFEAHQFHAGVRALMGFCTTTLSNLYFDVRKDCLYCDAPNSSERQACVWLLEHIFRGLVTHLAPIVPFTTDEAWRCRYGEDVCVHLETYAEVPVVEVDEARWKYILRVRDTVNQSLEKSRNAGLLGSNIEASLNGIILSNQYLSVTDKELLELVCGVSEFNFALSDYDVIVITEDTKHTGHKCPRCWRYYNTLGAQGICLRCEGAVAAQGKGHAHD